MIASSVIYYKPSELLPLSNNPRTITKEDYERLVSSIRINGFWAHRPLGVESRDGIMTVLCGNQRLKAAKKLRLKEVPCIVYADLTDEERIDLITKDNINNGTWDFGTLQTDDMFVGYDFEAAGLSIPEIDISDIDNEHTKKKATKEKHKEQSDDGMSDDDYERMSFYNNMIGDFLYDSDNKYEIPNLLLDQQPVHIELPLTAWGADARNKHGITTYHFYVEDYRFEKLFKDPINLLMSGCKQIVEPNCSIHDQTPVAMAMFQIYKKRYLARYFQECGVKVWADLNVSPKFAEYNMLGIPKGYNAFFTRGTEGFLHRVQLNLQIAQEISGKKRPNMCVYSGGSEIEEFCRENGLLYITEFMSTRKDAVKP